MAKTDKTIETISESRIGEYFPIRTVAEITGVNSITLRAWERRYGLLVPKRTPKGHRLYTQSDIDLIHRTVELLNKGVSIGQVKSHLFPKAPKKKTNAVENFPNLWVQYQQRMLSAIARFDNNGLMGTYNEVLSIYPIEIVTTHLILPLSKILGNRWESGEGTIAEEHFFMQFLRNKIGARFHHQQFRSTGPKIITTCFPEEHHEIGLLIFCLAAIDIGFNVVLLGPNLPLSELVSVVKQTKAKAIVLSGTSAVSEQSIKVDLHNLIESIDIPVFVGGNASILQCDQLKAAGAAPIGTDIQHGLKEIKMLLESD